MNNNELIHHGIPGQKWGVRRYQNSDGSLTRAGARQFKKTSRSGSARRKQTKQAVKILKKYQKHVDKSEKRLGKAIDRLSKKQGTDRRAAKIERYSIARQKLQSDSQIMSTRISAIKSGTMKAGRDFIVASRIKSIPYVAIGLTGPKVRKLSVKQKSMIVKDEQYDI